ncbi:MAG TPA: xanthine dehydrogenase, partial [Cytophagales bacterium]|nr:xanthine dehydrogenase [Cytophagales bacterium]
TDFAIGDPATWFEITAENRIIFHSPKVEMGQGAFTGLAQIAAEELEVDVNRIEVVHATTINRPLDPRSTGGSDSITALWNPLREVAAGLRIMLLINAAQILGVAVGDLKLDNGVISGKGESLTYGDVVKQATTWEQPEEITFKSRSEYKHIGKPVERIDLMPKLLGDPIFGMDQSLPGMLYGVIVHPPKIDTVMVSADTAQAEG